MYYITNQNNQIIAIDSSLLDLLEVNNIDELYKKIALDDIVFSSSEEQVTIVTSLSEESYAAQKSELSGILGNLTLIQIQVSPEKPLLIDEDISTFTLTESNQELSVAEDDDALIKDLLNVNLDTEEKISLPDNDLFEDDTFILEDSEEKVQDETIEKEEISLLTDDSGENEKDTVLFDLLLPDTPENALIDEISVDEVSLEDVSADEVSVDAKDTSPIFIDIENISQQIGISTKDYNIFLNEYVDTALSLEEDLLNTQEEKYSNAIDTLSHLSNVLHLPVLSEIITQIENATAEDHKSYIESFYTTLARLTTTQPDTHKEEPLLLPETESSTVSTESFGTISLDEVQSIHFDFQLEEAANDLALPVELIEEFVHDFIEQAHTETKKMLAAYEKGDLESIQKIGHLLKGASSNLRIKALADTLYEIQFCKDISKMEALIKKYWGHFLSLETQINLTSQTRK